MGFFVVGDVEDFGDVRMIDASENEGFRCGLAGELDRDLAVPDGRLDGEVDARKRPFAQLSD